MKKHIPKTLLQAETPNASKSTQNNSVMISSHPEQHFPVTNIQPVLLGELIESISQRNREAMSPLHTQKKHNKAVLHSVLRSIFSS